MLVKEKIPPRKEYIHSTIDTWKGSCISHMIQYKHFWNMQLSKDHNHIPLNKEAQRLSTLDRSKAKFFGHRTQEKQSPFSPNLLSIGVRGQTHEELQWSKWTDRVHYNVAHDCTAETVKNEQVNNDGWIKSHRMHLHAALKLASPWILRWHFQLRSMKCLGRRCPVRTTGS